MKKRHLAITTTTALIFVNKDEVLYCCGDGSYTNIYLEGGRKVTVSKHLKEIETALNDDAFVRVHNSHLININNAAAYVNSNYNCVKMKNGEELSVSRNRKKDLMERFIKI